MNERVRALNRAAMLMAFASVLVLAWGLIGSVVLFLSNATSSENHRGLLFVAAGQHMLGFMFLAALLFAAATALRAYLLRYEHRASSYLS